MTSTPQQKPANQLDCQGLQKLLAEYSEEFTAAEKSALSQSMAGHRLGRAAVECREKGGLCYAQRACSRRYLELAQCRKNCSKEKKALERCIGSLVSAAVYAADTGDV